MFLYLIPFICAFAGWLIMQIAVGWFFSPARSKKLVMHIAGSLGGIIDMETIGSQLTAPEKLKQLTPAIEAHLDQFLEVKLQEKLPVIATFVGPSTLSKIKEAMIEEIDILLPQLISQYTASAANELDVVKIISEKINRSDNIDLIIASAIRPQIKLIGVIGALVGFVSGIITLLLQARL